MTLFTLMHLAEAFTLGDFAFKAAYTHFISSLIKPMTLALLSLLDSAMLNGLSLKNSNYLNKACSKYYC